MQTLRQGNGCGSSGNPDCFAKVTPVNFKINNLGEKRGTENNKSIHIYKFQDILDVFNTFAFWELTFDMNQIIR